jgi:hypothetical protein
MGRREALAASVLGSIVSAFFACGAPLVGDDVAADGGSILPDGASASPDAGAAADANTDASDTSVPCVDGGVVANGHCYFRGPSGVVQSEARSACADAGAHLATVTSSAEEFVVKGIESGKSWIGLVSDTGSTDAAAYYWITGEDTTYQSWGTAEPDGEKCVVQEDYGWNSKACDDTSSGGYGSVCERP